MIYYELDGFQIIVPRSASPSPPGTLSEMRILWPHLKLAESETRRSWQPLLFQALEMCLVAENWIL